MEFFPVILLLYFLINKNINKITNIDCLYYNLYAYCKIKSVNKLNNYRISVFVKKKLFLLFILLNNRGQHWCKLTIHSKEFSKNVDKRFLIFAIPNYSLVSLFCLHRTGTRCFAPYDKFIHSSIVFYRGESCKIFHSGRFSVHAASSDWLQLAIWHAW